MRKERNSNKIRLLEKDALEAIKMAGLVLGFDNGGRLPREVYTSLMEGGDDCRAIGLYEGVEGQAASRAGNVRPIKTNGSIKRGGCWPDDEAN